MARSRTSDTTGHLFIEAGEQRQGLIADVAPVSHTGRTYSYAVPDALAATLQLGHRVNVPLGRRGRIVQGFVVGFDRGTWESTLRPIDSAVDDASFLTPELIELGREIAIHYACPLGRTLKAITPEAVRKQAGLKAVRYARLVVPMEQIEAAGRRLSTQRRALLDRLLAAANEPLLVERLLEETGVSSAILRGVAKEGWVEIDTRRELPADNAIAVTQTEPGFDLNVEQREALRQVCEVIDTGGFAVTLLHGVSGSGKTEVYIRAMRRVIESGCQAILLVPEIVLTTQLVSRLASRFSDVAVNHSGLTEGQRSIIWRQVAAGEKTVVIGTRSAVFAPCPNLGLICVDEEQEGSYKNLQAPRFNVRDVAIMRAKQAGFPVVVGSATPSIETFYNSEHRAAYRKVNLHQRVNEQPMPKVHVIDMRDELEELDRVVVLSRTMERLLRETLDRKEQAILLVNRRGFAERIYCPRCRSSLTCPNCNVSFVVHSATGQTVCHYCHHRMVTPTTCPNIGCGERLVPMGSGTQRVEEVLARIIPDARVHRVDSDTMRHCDEYQRIVDAFEARRIDVLVGTQMIAKGLDFPFVSFVGVVNADTAALAGDFRAQERIFQLITQVAGRAGRAETAGTVVVQTAMPDLPALRCALNHDYETFVRGELKIRQRIGFPPFRRLARVVLAHTREDTARHEAGVAADRIREAIGKLGLEYADVLGPSPCALSRLRGKYRYDLLIRTLNATAMRQLVAHMEETHVLRTKAESTIIDVDPVSLA